MHLQATATMVNLSIPGRKYQVVLLIFTVTMVTISSLSCLVEIRRPKDIILTVVLIISSLLIITFSKNSIIPNPITYNRSAI